MLIFEFVRSVVHPKQYDNIIYEIMQKKKPIRGCNIVFSSVSCVLLSAINSIVFLLLHELNLGFFACYVPFHSIRKFIWQRTFFSLFLIASVSTLSKTIFFWSKRTFLVCVMWPRVYECVRIGNHMAFAQHTQAHAV